MANPVLTKTEFVRRYQSGEFGNASPTWNTLDDWVIDRPWFQHGPLYHIRNRIAGGETWYDVDYSIVESVWMKAAKKVGAHNLYISAMAPTDKTVFQGEVQRGIWGLELFYSTVAKPMRAALAMQGTQVRGIIALQLLREYLCPNSYDWLMHLLRLYQDHVVEFSTYSREWGTLPGFNTVFWEVRKY